MLCFYSAFGIDTDFYLNDSWEQIPQDTDILVTHSPPKNIFDMTVRRECVGSPSLRNHVMDRIKPKLHIFGHIHECGGKQVDCVMTTFINASFIDENYEPAHDPVRIIL